MLILFAVIGLSLMAQYTIELPDSVGAIPITGQSFAVLLIAYLLGLVDGSIAIFIYLLLGIIGLPIFADGGSGLDAITGTSVGFLYGFLLTCLLTNVLLDRSDSDIKSIFQYMIVGTTLILLFGGLHLRLFISWEEVWMHGIEPFLPGAMVKLFIATIVAYGLKQYVFGESNTAIAATVLAGKSNTEEE